MFFILTVSSVITFIAQKSWGTVTGIDVLSLKIRIANSLISYGSYIGKTFWPSRLAVIYPLLQENLPIWQAAWAGLLLICVTVCIVWVGRRHRYLAVGWLWYLGTLVPVIGLVQVGTQSMADRYTYIPITGLFIIIAWGVTELLAKGRFRKITLGISMLVVVSVLSMCTRLQLRYWRNSVTLFEHAIAVTQDNYIAHGAIVPALLKQGKVDEAIAHNYEALRIMPDYAIAHASLAAEFNRTNEFDKAIEHCTKAIRAKPDFAVAHYNLGVALFQKDKVDDAINSFGEAVRLNKNDHKAHNNLAVALYQQGETNQAIRHWQEAIRINPGDAVAESNLKDILDQEASGEKGVKNFQILRMSDNAESFNDLGITLMRQGKENEAIEQFNKALQLKPDYYGAHFNLGVLLGRKGRLDEAAEHYSEAVRITPGYWQAHINFGEVLTNQGKLDEAIEHFSEAVRINPDSWKGHANLGLVLSSRGQFGKAAKHLEEAVRLDPNNISARYNLAQALSGGGKIDEAIVCFKEILRIKPDWVGPMNNLAWLLATTKEDNFRDAAEAIRLAERGCELTNYKNPALLDTLAAAYASAGRFSEAVGTAQKALELAKSLKQDYLIGGIEKRLVVYKSGQPYTEPEQTDW